MRSMNKMTLMGRLGKDPELRVGKTGHGWCSFTLATHRNRKEGDAWVEETDWHDVRVFGGDAEVCNRFLKRGAAVVVEGTLTYEKWQDAEGHRRTTARVLAERVHFIGAPPPRAESAAAAAAASEAAAVA